MTSFKPSPAGFKAEDGDDLPVIVDFAEHDPADPRAFSPARKWL
jgi:hypothetical protein